MKVYAPGVSHGGHSKMYEVAPSDSIIGLCFVKLHDFMAVRAERDALREERDLLLEDMECVHGLSCPLPKKHKDGKV